MCKPQITQNSYSLQNERRTAEPFPLPGRTVFVVVVLVVVAFFDFIVLRRYTFVNNILVCEIIIF